MQAPFPGIEVESIPESYEVASPLLRWQGDGVPPVFGGSGFCFNNPGVGAPWIGDRGNLLVSCTPMNLIKQTQGLS